MLKSKTHTEMKIAWSQPATDIWEVRKMMYFTQNDFLPKILFLCHARYYFGTQKKYLNKGNRMNFLVGIWGVM